MNGLCMCTSLHAHLLVTLCEFHGNVLHLKALMVSILGSNTVCLL